MTQQNNEPAFPIYTEDMPVEGTPGISKRFYAACKAMQGMMVENWIINDKQVTNIVKDAYKIADEMLKQENE